jgi:glycosyltransferase involved in cell wall biosynthesis
MLTVSPGVAEEWAGNPDWSHSRITGWLPLPIEPVDDHFQNRQPPSSSRRYLTLGYCGRLERGCKRADRIPTLLQEMDRIRLDYRFLILGTGPLEHKLRHELAGHPRVTFFGHLGGSKYWEILGSCDALVSLSDVEGMGMAVLDAMSIGVLPYYPDIGGGAERYVRRLGLGFLYPSGDLRFLAGELQTLGRLDPAENSRLRQTCREIVRPHTWEQYRDTYLRFLNKLIGSSSPCHFKPQPSSWQRLASLLPLGVIRRAMPRLLLVPWGLAAGPRSP